MAENPLEELPGERHFSGKEFLNFEDTAAAARSLRSSMTSIRTGIANQSSAAVGLEVNIVCTNPITSYQVNKLKKAVVEIIGPNAHIEEIKEHDEAPLINVPMGVEGIQCMVPVRRTKLISINIARICPTLWTRPQWDMSSLDVKDTLDRRLSGEIRLDQAISRFEMEGECLRDISAYEREKLLVKPTWAVDIEEQQIRADLQAEPSRRRPCIRGGCPGCMDLDAQGSDWSSTDDENGRAAEAAERRIRAAKPKTTPKTRIRTMKVQLKQKAANGAPTLPPHADVCNYNTALSNQKRIHADSVTN